MNRLQTSGTVAALAWLVLSFLALPAFAVIPVSFTDTRYLSLPQEHLSLQHWRTFLSSREWLSSIWQSLWIAAVSTVMAVTAGTLCAVGCWRIASRSSERVRSAMILPLAVPTIVYALGIYRLYVALDLVGTGLGVVLAHAVTGLPYVVLTVSASLSNLDPRLEQAARGLGASVGQTLRHVIVPNIVPGVLSGAIFAFIHSWDELIVVIFIGGRALFTLPRRMWDGINDNLDPVIAVVATGMILFTLLVLIAELSLRARRAESPVSTKRRFEGRVGQCLTIAIAWTISSSSWSGPRARSTRVGFSSACAARWDWPPSPPRWRRRWPTRTSWCWSTGAAMPCAA